MKIDRVTAVLKKVLFSAGAELRRRLGGGKERGVVREASVNRGLRKGATVAFNRHY